MATISSSSERVAGFHMANCSCNVRMWLKGKSELLECSLRVLIARRARLRMGLRQRTVMRNRCSSAIWVIVLAAINLCFGNAVGVAADSLEFPSTGCDQVMIDVTVLFDEPISDADIALFGAHGGSIGRVFKQIAHGWIGS